MKTSRIPGQIVPGVAHEWISLVIVARGLISRNNDIPDAFDVWFFVFDIFFIAIILKFSIDQLNSKMFEYICVTESTPEVLTITRNLMTESRARHLSEIIDFAISHDWIK